MASVCLKKMGGGQKGVPSSFKVLEINVAEESIS